MSEPRDQAPGDVEQTARLLRSPPAPTALAWAEESLETRVVRWEALRGGTSSAMYALILPDDRDVVLRCYVRRDVLDLEPDLPRREAAALRAVIPIEVPTPELLAVEEAGAVAGVPMVLMTRLPGRVQWEPRRASAWLERLASVLPTIHEVDATTDGLGVSSNYEQRSYDPPAWATDARIWERAVEIFHGPILETERRFVHRDFHPGNVLWQRSRLSGVVDWQAACVGPPSIDVAHCRVNFLLYRPELAEEFADIAGRETEQPFNRWADIAALIGMLDALRSNPPDGRARHAIEGALKDAVTACS